MRRLFALLGLALPLCARAGEFAPICSRPEILDFVRTEVRRSAPYGKLLPETVGEWPGRDPATVSCGVTIWQQEFYTGEPFIPIWLEYQYYRVRTLVPGYEVTMMSRIAAAPR